MLTQQDIHACLRRLGIRSDDTVLIHTSMRAIGPVENGCHGLIDGFVSYLSDGLFLVPTHTWSNVGASHPVFDVRSTPPCIGALPTVAAFREDGVRSLHPTHSMAAFGKRAADYVAGEERSASPCPPEGCWARLYSERAKILLLGVDLNRYTFLHAVDEMIGLPGRLMPPIPLTVIDRDGNRHELCFCKHGQTGSENFTNYRKPLETLGALTYGQLGNAAVICCDAEKSTHILRHLWQKADYDLCAEKKEIPTEYYLDFQA